MLKRILLICCSLSVLGGIVLGENCYLIVEKSGVYNPTTISDFAGPLISRYIEPVRPPGYEGVGARDCQYKISLSENMDGITIALVGPQAASFGESKEAGLKGVKIALLRAVYRAAPDRKNEVCNLYSSIIPEDCGLRPTPQQPPRQKYGPPVYQPAPTPPPKAPTPFNTDYEVLAVRFFEAGNNVPEVSRRVYKNRFNKSYSRYIYTEFKINNLQYRMKEHSHQMIWLYYNPDGSLRGRINGTFRVKSKWSTAWIYRGWGWKSYGNWPKGTYTVKIIVDGNNVASEQFTIY